MEEIAIKMNFPEKTAKFFGCHCSDTLILTNLKGCFGLTLGMTRLLVANLEITLSGIKFILLDDSGQQLLQFCNGVLSFHQDEDKIELNNCSTLIEASPTVLGSANKEVEFLIILNLSFNLKYILLILFLRPSSLFSSPCNSFPS